MIQVSLNLDSIDCHIKCSFLRVKALKHISSDLLFTESSDVSIFLLFLDVLVGAGNVTQIELDQITATYHRRRL